MSLTTTEIHLARRPQGWPTEEHFELVERELPDELEDGQLRVRNLYMSVDPYMRGRMRAAKSYAEPYRVGEVMWGGSVGVVEASRHDAFPEGTHVLAQCGWRTRYLSDGAGHFPIDVEQVSPSAYLGVLGVTGMTAWVGLEELADLEDGETVFVSAAAGAVGSVFGQLARLAGARVFGCAGSPEKIEFLRQEAGFEDAFDYRQAEDLTEALAACCPDGVDVYFDNVGAEMLEAALESMNDFGRIVSCGMIAIYNATTPPPAPRNLSNIITRRLRMEGFIVSDHLHQMPEFHARMRELLADDELVWRETVREGIEHAPQAFLEMMRGDKIGKMVVEL